MRSSWSRSVSVIAIALASTMTMQSEALAQDADVTAGEEDEPIIIVSGVRQSIESAIGEKRGADGIQDSITAEDIGQLANDNIAEALQRIAGVQVDRSDDGEGQGVQIRGLSDNNVLLNGETISGTAAERGVNFQDLPAELFSGVEILKTPTADSIEGTLGGTINLKTRRPLAGRDDFILNLSGTLKHAEVGDLWNQDGNIFVLKQWRDTGIGDLGVLLNFGYKETSSYAEVYGGGDFDDAPAIWVRHFGDQSYPTGGGGNLFNNVNVSGRPNEYRYDFGVDVNGDGVSDANDVYYLPNGFGFFERIRDDTKYSFNGTIEWAPSDSFSLRFDTTLTDINENVSGSRYSINFNGPRQGPLIGGPGNTFDLLGNTSLLGDVYIMSAGRVGAATNRIGAAPAVNEIDRESQQFSFEADWDVTPNLNINLSGSTSRGEAHTVVQGQLNTGIEHQGAVNSFFNAQDFLNIVDFSLGGPNTLPNVTFYESPFPAPNYGVTSQVANGDLVVLDPSNISYERQRYFQFQRNAADTENTDDSLRLDLTWEPDGGFITAVRTGARWAERSFMRASYQNSNQGGNGNVSTFSDGTRDPVRFVNIQRVPVDPNSTSDPAIAEVSSQLASCIGTAGRTGLLGSFGGNLPRTWDDNAGCDIQAISDRFDMFDIRAINPDTGVGYYEQTAERFDVSEETLAFYLRADFLSNIGNVGVFGNVGLRYIQTDTTSDGFIVAAGGGFDDVSLPGSYDDWLPSANVNFSLTDELLFRLAYSRTLGRPGLALISPGLRIIRSNEDPDFDGFGTSGNPDLNPVRAHNYDASLEWYYDKGSYLSVAVFQKDIDGTIFLDAANPVPLQIGDEVFSIQTFRNFAGTKVRGVEFGLAHAFNYLPGILRHLGVTANYTIVDEDSDLVDQEGDPISRRGLSRKTANLGAYYDDGGFSIRLAYNYRSDFTRRENVSLGFARPETLPETEASREQLDLAMRYNITKDIRVTLNAINLTDTGTERYMKYRELTNYLAFAGRRYNLGVSFRF